MKKPCLFLFKNRPGILKGLRSVINLNLIYLHFPQLIYKCTTGIKIDGNLFKITIVITYMHRNCCPNHIKLEDIDRNICHEHINNYGNNI